MSAVVYIVSILIIGYYIFIPHRSVWYSLCWKTLSSLSFLLVATVVMGQCSQEVYRSWMMVGLILGAVGDVALALADCAPERRDTFFLIGLGSFLAGHVSYAYALFAMELPYALAAGAISVLAGIIIIHILEKTGVQFEKMRLAAMMYAMVILFMELCAMQHLSLSCYGILLNIGTLCFVLSDLILAFILFKNQNTKSMVRWNLSLYYVAQLCILSTMWLY